jgi:hypothetical protein
MTTQSLVDTRLHVLAMLKDGILANDQAMVMHGFALFRDCAANAIAGNHLTFLTGLCTEVYKGLKYRQLIQDRISGLVDAAVFTEVLKNLAPDREEFWYIKSDRDDVATELMSHYLAQNKVSGQYLFHIGREFTICNTPKAFTLVLDAMFKQDDLLDCESRHSVIELVRQFCNPTHVLLEGAHEKAPAGTHRLLPNVVSACLLKHQDKLASAQNKLGFYDDYKTLPMDVIEQFSDGLDLDNINILTRYHRSNQRDPRMFSRVRFMGVLHETEKMLALFSEWGLRTHRVANPFSNTTGGPEIVDSKPFDNICEAWIGYLCYFLEHDEVSTQTLRDTLETFPLTTANSQAVIRALDATYKFAHQQPNKVGRETMTKAEMVALRLLEQRQSAVIAQDMLAIKYLPEAVALSPSLREDKLQIDLGI